MEDKEKEKVMQTRGGINVGRDNITSPLNTGDQNNVRIDVDTSGMQVTSSQTITIDKMYLDKMPTEYAESLKTFTSELNQNIEKAQIAPKDVKQLQESANAVAKEAADIKLGEEEDKKYSLGDKLSDLAQKLVKAAPGFAEKIVSMTPLAPFSKIIGEGFEKIVGRYLKKEQQPTKTPT